jgi:hypothetical protein
MKQSTFLLLSATILSVEFIPLESIAKSSQSNCDRTISQVKSQLLLQEYGRNVYIKKDDLHTSVPNGRPYNVTFVVQPGDESGDPRKGNKQLKFSKNIILNCHHISSVTFYVSGTDFEATYGIMKSQLKQFKCYYFTASGEKIPWGYNLAHARCSMKR